jgi:hypothetical protein
VHQAPITQDGWSGAGFTAIDPQTGAGGYLIEGGSNGAYFEKFQIGLVVVGIIGSFLGASAFFIIALTLISLAASLIEFFLFTNPCGDLRDDVNLWLTLGLTGVSAVLGLFANIGQSIAAAVAGWIYGTIVRNFLECGK